MKSIAAKLVILGLLIFYSGCATDSLTGVWDCTLLGVSGESSAWMQLTEDDGQVRGTFNWNELKLQINGTVNSERQVNMETQDSNHRIIFNLRSLKSDTFLDGSFSYYKNYLFIDGGSFDATKR